MKEIQGGAGVHILLDPLSEDLKDSISSFDFRLPLTDNNHQKIVYPAVRPGQVGGYPRISDPSNEAVPLTAVRVFGLSGRGTDVSVVTSGPKGSLSTFRYTFITFNEFLLLPSSFLLFLFFHFFI